ncbi:MAG: nucleotidyltransferase [Candidatus Buchananbacteria bacterium RIFCSPLOWO2_01_FULL_56_15]|uniref:Nucleotidyltransferase n=1 Tax=Candidatus Buchananbacteria bacterium RIFCSPLOWO2_01_FULL_56_15 TaxID=1797547 RepID=A0A1G1YR27_9BACT|nr:MAG: nucleotidyltransferase [Candidatus Buchananbacteria bacterium RIFCSPLOWO2_01_FULL_56_15]
MNGELKKSLTIINQKFDSLKKDYGVKKIGVFGSFVSGRPRKDSDIDILVEFSQPVSLFEFIEVEDFLSKALKRKVDLVTKNALKPAIKKDVLNEVVYV